MAEEPPSAGAAGDLPADTPAETGGLVLDATALSDHLSTVVPLLLGGSPDDVRAALATSSAAHKLKT